MIIWPESLPQCFLPNGFSEEGADNLIASSNDVGPDKVRRRTTSSVYKISGSIKCTPDQKNTFKSFFYDDIKSGVVPFNFPNSSGGDLLLVRVVPPFKLTRVGVSWRLKLDLEVLP